MRINTPNPDGGDPIVKEIVVNGGVTVRLPGYRYSMQGHVLELDEEGEGLRVALKTNQGVKMAIVALSAVRDSTNPEEREWQEIYDNNITHGK